MNLNFNKKAFKIARERIRAKTYFKIKIVFKLKPKTKKTLLEIIMIHHIQIYKVKIIFNNNYKLILNNKEKLARSLKELRLTS